MGLEESPLAPTEILSLKYKSKSESNTESVFSAYQLPPLTSPSLTPSPPLPYTAMSQHDLYAIIRQQQG